jgi:two-component system, NarL family, nitrate/nitrite response regulator NarL
MPLRVLVVSDVRFVRDGLCSVLAAQVGIDVVNDVDTHQARERSTQLRPDIVLFDAARPESVQHVRDLVALIPHSKVIAFGVRENDAEILALAAAGTAGYIRESSEIGDVVRVLERVMCDELLCSPRTAASLYRRVAVLSQSTRDPDSVADPRNCAASLSQREMQIAQLVDRGLTNKQIGRQLGIEPATVKNHVHNICEKLNVHRRGEAVARIRTILRSRAALLAPAPEVNPALGAR